MNNFHTESRSINSLRLPGPVKKAAISDQTTKYSGCFNEMLENTIIEQCMVKAKSKNSTLKFYSQLLTPRVTRQTIGS